MTSIRPSALPATAFLNHYAQRGDYTDCYAIDIPRHVPQKAYVAAFYTTPVFKLERWLLALFLSRPSSDAQAQQLAAGDTNQFAAWTVEQRADDQLLLAAGNTRSWLMALPGDANRTTTTLYFGSAVVKNPATAAGRKRLGWPFKALLGFHKLYSRVLLAAACRKLAAIAPH